MTRDTRSASEKPPRERPIDSWLSGTSTLGNFHLMIYIYSDISPTAIFALIFSIFLRESSHIMQLFLTVFLFFNILEFTYACQQWKVGFVTKENACELDAGHWRNACLDLTYDYIEYSRSNGARLGHDITGTTSCDTCDTKNPKCYCRITFWRYREWMGTTIPYLENAVWSYDKNGDVFGKIPHKNIDCD